MLGSMEILNNRRDDLYGGVDLHRHSQTCPQVIARWHL